MSAHPAFGRELTESLAKEFASGSAVRDAPRHLVSPPPEATRTPKSLFRSLVRRPIARYLDHHVAAAMDIVMEAALGAVHSRASQLADALSQRVAALEINQELLKAELRAIIHNLEHVDANLNAMAAAIAPTAGIEGVPERLAEFRERLNAVERRSRNLVSDSDMPSVGSASDGKPQLQSFGRSSSPIDYVGFERRFRGDPARVQAITRERYLNFLLDNSPVLDVGCGRGELVDTLVASGVAASGIDIDPAMVAEARTRGLDVRVADLNEHLEGQHPASIGAIISTQVVEHLQVDDLVRFLALSVSRLKPGGLFIAETPNPASLIVLGTHFILDPTHVRPIHPALMVYLCECAGFRSIELMYFEPARDYHLPMLRDDDKYPWVSEINASFTKLNNILFGPQDYAVIARTPNRPRHDSGAAVSP